MRNKWNHKFYTLCDAFNWLVILIRFHHQLNSALYVKRLIKRGSNTHENKHILYMFNAREPLIFNHWYMYLLFIYLLRKNSLKWRFEIYDLRNNLTWKKYLFLNFKFTFYDEHDKDIHAHWPVTTGALQSHFLFF